MAEDWSDQEVSIIINDYFSMLTSELAGQPYNKAEHRKALLPLLNGRSEGSIEFKHQNISAVLVDLGEPYITGYKPRQNYQDKLFQYVMEYLGSHIHGLEPLFLQFSDAPIKAPSVMDFDHLLEPAPEFKPKTKEPKARYGKRPVKINHLEREQQNTVLGFEGEKYVIRYEKWRLKQEGNGHLIDNIEWISQHNDSAGFDIRSFNPDGSERLIEVKTTKLAKETPFFFSRTEYECAQENAGRYYLYRLFNFDTMPKMFIQQGSFDTFCHIEAIGYKGSF